MLLKIASIILIYWLTKWLTGYGLRDFIKWVRNYVSYKVMLSSAKVDYEMSQVDKIKRDNSIRGRYVRFMNEVIIDLGWKKDGIGVGSVTVTVVFVSIVSTILLSIILGMELLIPLIFPSIFLLITFSLFTVSRHNHSKRLEAVMTFIDMIAPVMASGPQQAIELYQDAAPDIIRPAVKRFVQKRQSQNITFAEAVNELTEDLGEIFRDFASKMIIFEAEEQEGMHMVFQDSVVVNARIRDLNREKEKVFKSEMFEFFGRVIIVIVGVIAFVLIIESMRELMMTQVGKLIAVVDMTLLVIAYSYAQFIQTDVKRRK